VLVFLAEKLLVLGDVALDALPLAPAGDRLLELRALARERRELAAVRDDGRVGDQPLELRVAALDLRQALEHLSSGKKRGGGRSSAWTEPRHRRPTGRPTRGYAGWEPGVPLRPYFRWKRSTRPAVSTSFCLPVKNGWHAAQISTWIWGTVERVSTTLPQAQTMLAFSYRG